MVKKKKRTKTKLGKQEPIRVGLAVEYSALLQTQNGISSLLAGESHHCSPRRDCRSLLGSTLSLLE